MNAKNSALLKTLSLFFLTLATFMAAQVFLINNNVFEPSNGYFTESQLRDMGFNIVKNERVYLIHNRKLIIGSDSDFLVDFQEYVPKAYTIVNGVVFVKADFISSFFKLSKMNDVYYDKPFSITFIDYTDDVLTIGTSVPAKKEFLSASLSNNTLSLKLSPAQCDLKTPAGVSVSRTNHTTIITVEKAVSSYNITYSENKIVVRIEPVIRKIEYTKRTEIFAGRTFTINYMIADPRHTNITPLLPAKGIGSMATLANILSYHGFSSGVNANYFDPATGLPIDIVISNGRVLSHRYGLRPMFIQTTDGRVFIKKAYVDITVRIGDVLLLVKGVNTTSLGEVNLYTSEFALKIPNDRTRTYVVVKDGKIASIGYISAVPSNSEVIMISNDVKNKFLPNLTVGQTVTVELYTDDGYQIKNAVGAGPLLLQDGNIIPDAAEEKLRYGGGIPTTRANRTIIAIKDGKVHLITIEGKNGVGMNFDEAAQFLKSKGYDSAMMLDGGSSTSMVYAGKYVTSGTPRNIPVALGVK
ncbi:MAG: phosphodiester glycosidase family protein [Fervidobacterium sp.]|uniref:phosphodiester glycosidase family protein n=1 Tax=Fervidobacterium sp. TaxID=1871331 RepID=UPI0025BAF271|nr:phosphodiester glycosidase family protein [Fervidobacterium sp.]NPU89533.1 phosphodiester glycosidase family protein [Fervidobacterium sp.]